MMLQGSIDGGDLDFTALLEEDLSPAAQSAALAQFAREQLAEADKVNADALGFTPPHTTLAILRVSLRIRSRSTSSRRVGLRMPGRAACSAAIS
jgi:hypothetical protein